MVPKGLSGLHHADAGTQGDPQTVPGGPATGGPCGGRTMRNRGGSPGDRVGTAGQEDPSQRGGFQRPEGGRSQDRPAGLLEDLRQNEPEAEGRGIPPSPRTVLVRTVRQQGMDLPSTPGNPYPG